MKKIIAGIALIVTIQSLQAQNWTSAKLTLSDPSISTTTISSQKTSIRKGKKAGESDFYVRIYGGYGLSIGNSYKPQYSSSDNIVSVYAGIFSDKTLNSSNGAFDLNLNYNQTINGSTTTVTRDYTYKDNNVGFGKAGRVGIGLGYIVSDFINIGLDVDYFFGIKAKSPQNLSFTTTFGTGSINGEISAETTLLSFSPNVMFKAVSESNFSIYNRIGLSLGMMSPKGTEISSTASSSFTSTSVVNFKTITKYDYSSGLGVGFNVGLGGNISVSDAMTLFVEFQYFNMNYSPKKRTLKEVTQNIETVTAAGLITTNTDLLNGKNLKDGSNVGLPYTTRQKEIEYSKEFTDSFTTTTTGTTIITTNTLNSNSPKKSTSFRMPVSTLGLQVGLMFRF